LNSAFGDRRRKATAKEEAGPSPIRAERVWAQDDNKDNGNGNAKDKGSGKKSRSKPPELHEEVTASF
jgi:hypothetical protein